ncbi:MAG: PEP-CTERM sorting domain-containing protein [Verrucomicrobiota bacterium]
MNSHHPLRGTALAVLSSLLLGVLPLNAMTIITTIDSLSSGAQTIDLSGTTGSSTDTFTGGGGSIIGGERDLTLTVTANPQSAGAEVIITAGTSNLLVADLGLQVEAATELLYNGVGAAGLGGVDLTSGGANAFAIGIELLDLDLNIEIAVTDTGGDIATFSTTEPGGIFSSTTREFVFSNFSNLGATDFTSVDSVRLTFATDNPGADLVLDVLGTSFVPEPSRSLTILTGLALCFLNRRRPALRS